MGGGGAACFGARAAPPQQADPLLPAVALAWGPGPQTVVSRSRGPCFAELTLFQATPGPEVGRLQEAPTLTSPKPWGSEAGALLMVPSRLRLVSSSGYGEGRLSICPQLHPGLLLPCAQKGACSPAPRTLSTSPHPEPSPLHSTPGLPSPGAGGTPGQPSQPGRLQPCAAQTPRGFGTRALWAQ